MPGRIRRPPSARRPGAEGRASAGRSDLARRSPDRRAPGDADRRARRRLHRQSRSERGKRGVCAGIPPHPRSRHRRMRASARSPSSTGELSSDGSTGDGSRGSIGEDSQRRPLDTIVTSPIGARSSIGRLVANPFRGVPKADEKADPRRRRRAMTEDELERLLDVARRRPLLDAMTVHRGKRKGQAVANVRPETRARLEALGRERALIYKTLVLTGLRKDELASLTVGQLRLDEPAASCRAGRGRRKEPGGQRVPIRADLAEDLRAWLAGKLADARKAAMRQGEPIPARLPAETSALHRPGWVGPDLRPGLEACRHRQARRPGPDPRHPCLADDVRHAA